MDLSFLHKEEDKEEDKDKDVSILVLMDLSFLQHSVYAARTTKY